MIDVLIHHVVAVGQHGTQCIFDGYAVAVGINAVITRVTQRIDITGQLTCGVIDVLACAQFGAGRLPGVRPNKVHLLNQPPCGVVATLVDQAGPVAGAVLAQDVGFRQRFGQPLVVVIVRVGCGVATGIGLTQQIPPTIKALSDDRRGQGQVDVVQGVGIDVGFKGR